MRDGRTEKLATPTRDEMAEFRKREVAKLVVVKGDNAGEEFTLDRAAVIIGRGPSVDWVVNDTAISRQHAAIEFVGDEFRIRDLGSTNGVIVDGEPVDAAALAHGDRFQIGGREFQLVIEERELTEEIFELHAEV